MSGDLSSRLARFFGAEDDASTGGQLRAAMAPVAVLVIAAVLQRVLDLGGLLAWLALVAVVTVAWGLVVWAVRAARSPRTPS